LWKSIEGINKEGCHPFENLYPFSGNIVSSSNNKHSAKCRQPMLNNECIGKYFSEKGYCELPQVDYKCFKKRKSSKEKSEIENSCFNSYQIMDETNSIIIPFNTKQIKMQVSFGTQVYLHSLQIEVRQLAKNKFRYQTTYSAKNDHESLFLLKGPKGKGRNLVRRRFNKNAQLRGQSTVDTMKLTVRLESKLRKRLYDINNPPLLILQFFGCSFP